MAIILNGSTQYGTIASAVKTAVPLTMVGWVKFASLAAVQGILDLKQSTAAINANHFRVDYDNGSGHIRAVTNASAAAHAAALSTGVWYQFIAEFVATNSRNVLVDGASAVNNNGSATPASINQTNLGRIGGSANSNYLNGKLCAVGIYGKSPLSAEERLRLQTLSPLLVSPSDLLAYWPLVSNGDAHLVGQNWTLVGSPTFDQDVPPIVLQAGSWAPFF